MLRFLLMGVMQLAFLGRLVGAHRNRVASRRGGGSDHQLTLGKALGGERSVVKVAV